MVLQDIKPLHILWSKFHTWVSLVRLVPFETDTPEGRSKERLRRVALTALVSAFAQGVNMLTVLISVPLALNYLGTERYGLWITISSLITVLGFADLGIGNGLLNSLADAHGRNDFQAARSHVSSAFYMLLGIAGLFGILWIFLYPRISWNWLFNLTSPRAIAEAGPALAVFVWSMLINLVLGLVQKIHEGYQEGYINGLWRATGSLLSLAAVVIAIYFEVSLPVLVLAMVGSPSLTLVLNALFLFFRQHPTLQPRWRMVTRTAVSRVLKHGILFFVLQLAVVIAYQSDNLVIAHYLGANAVPQYAVPMKLFMIIPSLLGFIIAPLWPAYGEAIARKDILWVRRVFTQSLLISFSLSLFPTIFLILFGAQLIEFWVGPSIQPDLILLLGLGLWILLSSVGGPISMLLNGTNVIGFQIICATLMGLGNLAFSIFLVQRIGVSGPVYGSILAWTLFSLLPSLFYLPRLFTSWKKLES